MRRVECVQQVADEALYRATRLESVVVLSLDGDVETGAVGPGGVADATVIGFYGRELSPNAPTAGQAYVWNGSVWIPTSVGESMSITQIIGDVLAGPGPGEVSSVVVQARGGAVLFYPNGNIVGAQTAPYGFILGIDSNTETDSSSLVLGNQTPDSSGRPPANTYQLSYEGSSGNTLISSANDIWFELNGNGGGVESIHPTLRGWYCVHTVGAANEYPGTTTHVNVLAVNKGAVNPTTAPAFGALFYSDVTTGKMFLLNDGSATPIDLSAWSSIGDGAAGNILIGQGTSTPPTWNALSQDGTLSSLGALTVTQARDGALTFSSAGVIGASAGISLNAASGHGVAIEVNGVTYFDCSVTTLGTTTFGAAESIAWAGSGVTSASLVAGTGGLSIDAAAGSAGVSIGTSTATALSVGNATAGLTISGRGVLSRLLAYPLVRSRRVFRRRIVVGLPCHGHEHRSERTLPRLERRHARRSAQRRQHGGYPRPGYDLGQRHGA